MSPLSIIQVFALTALALLVYICCGYLFTIVKKRADVADIAWGPGFLLITWVSSFLTTPMISVSWMVNLLITFWALRLMTHIFLRNRHRPEDFRYQNLKKGWKGSFYTHLFFQVFLLQGIILFLVASPLIWIHTHANLISFNTFWLILPLWIYGFLMEAVSDFQLLQFQKNPENRGKILETGLFSFSRHPNHLGEMIQWWAIWALALSLPYGWAFIFSPLLLSILIIWVSGVAPLEEKMKDRPGFAAYAKRVPILAPFSLFNGLFYFVIWYILVSYAPQWPLVGIFLFFITCYGIQIFLFSRFDWRSFRSALPLSLSALLLGALKEAGLIATHTLSYPNHSGLPPLWVLALYSFFSLTLNSSLSFLNRHLAATFLIAGFGGVLATLQGAKLGAVELHDGYLLLFTSWGLFVTLLILINRILLHNR